MTHLMTERLFSKGSTTSNLTARLAAPFIGGHLATPAALVRSLVAIVALVICIPSLGKAQTVANGTVSSTSARGKTSEIKPGPTIEAAPWQELHAEQKHALQPLAQIWDTLTSGQQLKWLNLAANFKKMSPQNQAKLQSRMHEWASLGMRERDQARIGFAETRQLTDEQKKAKWAAYQALSPDEKQALAQQNPVKNGLAAKSTAPVPKDKKVNMPKASTPAPIGAASVPLVGAVEKRKPRLAAVPEKVAPNTLLPTDKH